jgi:hypothetical protein
VNVNLPSRLKVVQVADDDEVETHGLAMTAVGTTDVLTAGIPYSPDPRYFALNYPYGSNKRFLTKANLFQRVTGTVSDDTALFQVSTTAPMS